MATTKDILKQHEPPSSYNEGSKNTLLSKYEIPIQHFEFDYIEKCNDGKELEKILLILRSGEEGHYPDLIECTENRLKLLKPKSKLLRKLASVLDKNDLRTEELQELSEDLVTFVSLASKNDKELESRRNKNNYHEVGVRSFQELESNEEPSKDSEKRITSTDYKAWDKYDPDTELLKMELEEEKSRREALLVAKKETKAKPKKTVTFNKFTTEAESTFFSNREREKGNEFFKAGDYEEALQCYNNSVQSKANVNNLNNRAVTFLKLKKYREALEDCERVLNLEGDNLKAHLRKADALEGLNRFEEALRCVEFVIQRDPNNFGAQEVAERVRRKCDSVLKSTRLKIIEIE